MKCASINLGKQFFKSKQIIMSQKTVVSKQFTLQGRDWIKAALIATLTPVVVLVQQSLEAGSLVFDWKSLGMAALGGLVAYLAKNFFESTKTVTITKE